MLTNKRFRISLQIAAFVAIGWVSFASTITSSVGGGGGGGTPGGSTAQLQYNNAGAFGGISGATSDGTSLTVTNLSVSGLTGATSGGRLAGATASGAPASGTFLKGDLIIDQTGKTFVCSTAGSPGTWTQTGSTYTLPTATSSVLGGVKPDGASILNSAGVISATASSVGAAPSASPSFSGYVGMPVVYAVGNVTGSTTLNLNNGNYQSLTLTGNTTITSITAPTSGKPGPVVLFVTSGGAYTLTITGAKTISGNGILITTGTGGSPVTDVLSGIYDGSTLWIASSIPNGK